MGQVTDVTRSCSRPFRGATCSEAAVNDGALRQVLQHLSYAPLLDRWINLLRHAAILSDSKGYGTKLGALQHPERDRWCPAPFPCRFNTCSFTVHCLFPLSELRSCVAQRL